MKDQDTTQANRRSFLMRLASVAGAAPLGTRLGASAGLAAVVSVGQAANALAADPPATDQVLGYETLSQDEAAFVEAMVNVMCPADGLTPRGVDCGLATYIDRQLASGFGQGARHYLRGPWKQGKPQLGYQLPLTPAQFFKVGVNAASAQCNKKYGKGFDQLSGADADAFLDQLASGKIADPRVPLDSWFNDLVYPLFVQACFADPIYGGNRNKVFWKMVGYPGLPATHARDMVEFRGKPYPGAKDPKSIVDFS
jgi:gluconate 2-dehydrogenase gamma chain